MKHTFNECRTIDFIIWVRITIEIDTLDQNGTQYNAILTGFVDKLTSSTFDSILYSIENLIYL